MPSVSKKQHNAMEAAAHGKSTLGIPKSVGEDFSNADKGKKFVGGGPITAASIEAGGTPNQNGNFATPTKAPTNTPISTPAISSAPKNVDPISTTNTPPGGGYGGGMGGGLPINFGPTNPGNSSPAQTFGWGDTSLENGGMVPNTMGASYSFPPPPGQRKQGPRNYGKKE